MPTQLEEIQRRLGDDKLTEETAIDKLMAAYDTLLSRATAAESKAAAAEGKVTELSRAVPNKAAPDPEALRDRADLTLGRIDLALERGDMPAAIADKLKGMVRDSKGEPQAFMLSRQDGFNERPIEAILKLFDGAKLGVASNRKANAIVLDRTTPADPGEKPTQKALMDEGLQSGQAYQDEQLRARGLLPAGK